MFDLGTSLIASAERDPDAIAIVDGDIRLTYGEWVQKISALAWALEQGGVRHGDHVVSVLQNTWQAMTLHWACQLAGVIITPVNWRATADDMRFTVDNADAVAVISDSVAEAVVNEADLSAAVSCLRADAFDELIAQFTDKGLYPARATADDWSLMLYTSGTTARPKGVPRRHRAERAAAMAHVAQNAYQPGEVTLGVMPVYHTMGVRSLLAMTLVSGTFVCLPTWSAARALEIIEQEGVSNLYLVPTLFHDLLNHPGFADERVARVRKIGFAGAPMTDDLLQRVDAAFRPELFVNHYGSSEIYTFTIDTRPTVKPGSAGRAGLNSRVRVVPLGSRDATTSASPGEEGEIVASLGSDEAFEAYWRRPEANEKSLRGGWYFTGDTGYMDEDGDLFVTGRADDMIITGGENVSPVEIESCLSLHPAVDEVAVVGLPDERWGKVVTAFVKRSNDVSAKELDAHCLSNDLARFKRPRNYVFVAEIPKSPVGKLLRRLLVSGDFKPET